jgi:RimJ/RimL family protein N-acetyltransferase
MQTTRVIGRPPTEADVSFVMSTFNDARVTALVLETMTEHQVRDRIERWSRHRSVYGTGTEVFLESSSGQPVGWGGLQHSTIGIGEHLTIGYAIAPDLWGRGYAAEIAVASVALAFERLEAPEVRASILWTNHQSRRVAEKAGMTLECEVPHGELIEAIYLIDRDRWARHREQDTRTS